VLDAHPLPAGRSRLRPMRDWVDALAGIMVAARVRVGNPGTARRRATAFNAEQPLRVVHVGRARAIVAYVTMVAQPSRPPGLQLEKLSIKLLFFKSTLRYTEGCIAISAPFFFPSRPRGLHRIRFAFRLQQKGH